IGVVLANLTISVTGYQAPTATGLLVSFLTGCRVAALAALPASLLPARKPTRRRVDGAMPEERQLAAARPQPSRSSQPGLLSSMRPPGPITVGVTSSGISLRAVANDWSSSRW